QGVPHDEEGDQGHEDSAHDGGAAAHLDEEETPPCRSTIREGGRGCAFMNRDGHAHGHCVLLHRADMHLRCMGGEPSASRPYGGGRSTALAVAGEDGAVAAFDG